MKNSDNSIKVFVFSEYEILEPSGKLSFISSIDLMAWFSSTFGLVTAYAFRENCSLNLKILLGALDLKISQTCLSCTLYFHHLFDFLY